MKYIRCNTRRPRGGATCTSTSVFVFCIGSSFGRLIYSGYSAKARIVQRREGACKSGAFEDAISVAFLFSSRDAPRKTHHAAAADRDREKSPCQSHGHRCPIRCTSLLHVADSVHLITGQLTIRPWSRKIRRLIGFKTNRRISGPIAPRDYFVRRRMNSEFGAFSYRCAKKESKSIIVLLGRLSARPNIVVLFWWRIK